MLTPPDWLAELRSSDRVRAYRTVTRFVAAADGLRVTKVRAEAAAVPGGSPIGLLLPTDSPLLAGSPLGSRVRRLLRSPGIDADILAAVLLPWVESLRSATSKGPRSELPGDLLDLVPWNLMEPEGRPLQASDSSDLTPFDLEWEYRPELTVTHVVFRGLASVLLGVHGRSRLADEVTRGALLHEIGVRLGASLDPGTTEELLLDSRRRSKAPCSAWTRARLLRR